MDFLRANKSEVIGMSIFVKVAEENAKATERNTKIGKKRTDWCSSETDSFKLKIGGC